MVDSRNLVFGVGPHDGHISPWKGALFGYVLHHVKQQQQATDKVIMVSVTGHMA